MRDGGKFGRFAKLDDITSFGPLNIVDLKKSLRVQGSHITFKMYLK